MPTASAVMGDVIDCMRNILHGSCGKIGCGCYLNLSVKPIEETVSRFFLRIQVADKPGALANIAGILGNNDVSIEQVVQKKSHNGVPLRYNKDTRKNPVFSRVSAFVVAYSIPFPTLIVNEKSVE